MLIIEPFQPAVTHGFLPVWRGLGLGAYLNQRIKMTGKAAF